MIKIENLTKQFKNKKAVNNLNLTINDKELFSLLGVNGAGKSTTIKMLTGLIKPTNGKVTINNYDLINDIQKIKSIINVSPQETAIVPSLTVKENLDFIADVYQIRNKNGKINELLEDFKLNEVEDQKAKTLSGGWQRRLSIAMSLINEPEILFLDEPTLGLDVIARRELWNVIEKQKNKTTIVLTTHYMEEAEKLSDRIGIMNKGTLVDVGTPKELLNKTKSKDIEEAFVKLATGGEE